jgi:hypothetical protein
MLLIWKRVVPWTWIFLLLAVTAEFGQKFGLIEGSFDVLDLCFYLGGFTLAVLFNEKTPLVHNSCRDYGDLGPRQH